MRARSSPTALFEEPGHLSEGLVSWAIAHDTEKGIREKGEF